MINKKKSLIARTFGVGKGRIVLNEEMQEQLKEAITRQDMRDLFKSGFIIRDIPGRKKARKHSRRKAGSIRKKIISRKRKYIDLVRRMRAYLKTLKKSNKLNRENYLNLRKKSKAKVFSDMKQLKDYIRSKND